MIVVKVGGSLYDDPRLGPKLRAWLAEQVEPVTVVPGGGAFADAVRAMDAVHGLGEVSAHRLAIRAMALAGAFLDSLVCDSRLTLFDSLRFLDDPTISHSWQVTSDSLAAIAARQLTATKLVLLKSIDIPPGTPWDSAAAHGWVDPHFPTAVQGVTFAIEAINFRSAWG